MDRAMSGREHDVEVRRQALELIKVERGRSEQVVRHDIDIRLRLLNQAGRQRLHQFYDQLEKGTRELSESQALLGRL